MTTDHLQGMLIMLAVVGLAHLARWVLDIGEALRARDADQRARMEA